jgi:hypothetical protein
MHWVFCDNMLQLLSFYIYLVVFYMLSVDFSKLCSGVLVFVEIRSNKGRHVIAYDYTFCRITFVFVFENETIWDVRCCFTVYHNNFASWVRFRIALYWLLLVGDLYLIILCHWYFYEIIHVSSNSRISFHFIFHWFHWYIYVSRALR